jgi:cob(I)alamin adenosyltransferase
MVINRTQQAFGRDAILSSMCPKSSGLGLIQVYTGNGKGKTTAALGLALRAWGRGLRVCVIQFMKVGEEYGEISALRRLSGIDLFQYGRNKLIIKGKHTKEDVRLAKEGLSRAREALSGRDYDVVILDEVNVVAHFGIVTAEEVIEVVRARAPGVEVIMTGRNAPQSFIDEADLVTEMRMVKHPYEAGVLARAGIEF